MVLRQRATAADCVSGRVPGGLRPRVYGLVSVGILFSCVVSVGGALYEASASLEVLDSNNFHEVLLGKQTAWVVEFYAKWCGHCKSFAPVFRALAEDIAGKEGAIVAVFSENA